MKNFANNRLIIKNTVFLYFRMFIMMGISLYTSRVILNSLGVIDYGIYNLVGGVVLFFHFFNSTISGTLQRFFNVEMGENDGEQLNALLNSGILLQCLFSLIIILLSESFGIWLVNNYLKITPDRLWAANVVFQLSIFTFCINLLRTPFQAILVASEKMNFYAYISILEALIKLGSASILNHIKYDKLVVYSLLQLVIVILVLYFFVKEVNKQFGFKYKRFDTNLFPSIISFSGWNLLGASFALTVNQIMNIFLNVFYGVVTNAASALATQISSAINQFAANFSMAFSPQIVKLYAANQINEFRLLMFRASKTSFLLYLMVALPFICLADNLFLLWLVDIPDYAVLFSQLCVIDLAIESFTSPLYSSIQASGRVKKFNIGISIIFMFNIPLMYIALKYGYKPYDVFFVKIFVDIANLLFRVVYMCRYAPISFVEYLHRVIFPCITVVILLLPVVFLIINQLNFIIKLVITLFLLCPLEIIASLYLCYNFKERNLVISMIKNRIHKR